jgi:membrane protease subunit HflC
VLQFGQIRQVIEEPGLNFKIPFIQEVVYYDDRILSLDTAAIEVTPSDDRRLVVDAFARYRIVDVVQFRQAVGVGGLRTGEDRLERIINPQIREVLGADGVTSNTILSADRAVLMQQITATRPGRGAAARARGPRRAPEADQPAGAEPRGDLRPDAGRTRTRSRRRDRAR